jgi:site-specific recombinase XerD
MTIRLNLKRTTGKTTTVRAIVRINGVKSTLSTGIKVETCDWDRKRERCKSDMSANQKLEEFREQIKEYISKNAKPPQKSQIKEVQKTGILQSIEERREKLMITGAVENSWRAYDTLKSLVIRYNNEEKRKEKEVEEMTTEYIERFILWMIGKNFSAGHVCKMTRVLKSVTLQKTKSKVWENIKKPKNQPGETVYLSTDEIAMIEAVELPAHLDRARDLFLIGCFTALRFSDWTKVDKTRMKELEGVQVVTIIQQKTKGHTTLPVSNRLKKVLMKYPGGLPKLSNQKENKSIKEVCKAAGITQKVSVTEYKGGKDVTTTAPKWTFISTHTARRSFATNAIMAGIPVSEVMKFTGHKSISAFMQYIRTTGQEAAVKYSSHPFFQ